MSSVHAASTGRAAGHGTLDDEAWPKRPRVQLDFTRPAFKRLRELKDLAGLRSLPDVFREALRVYEWYLIRKSEGYRLQIMKDGRTTDVDLGI